MMLRMILSTRVAVLLVILAVSSGGAYAETVDHHGSMVDSEGYAVYCRSCHAGKTEMYMPDYIRNNTNRSHKILIKYPTPGREKDLASLEAVLAAGIKLEDGQVTCISCHNLRNPLRYHFAIDQNPFAQKLCYTCHTDIY